MTTHQHDTDSDRRHGADDHGVDGHGDRGDHGHGDRGGHGHGHGDPAHIDWDVIAPLLEQGAEVHTPLFEQAAGWLRELFAAGGGPGAGSVRRVLDVGSGPGVVTCVLARAFPEAEVVAVDPTPALLERVGIRAERLGLGDRVRTHAGELPDGLGEVGTADLIWSSKAVHHVGDQRAAVRALAGALRPGGLLALSEGGLGARSLPRDFGIGRPGLEARLEALHEEAFARMRAGLPGAKEAVENWPGFLAAAGLDTTTGSRGFLLDLPAPLGPEARAYISAQMTRLAEQAEERLDAEDRATLARLLDADDPAGLAHRPDLFLMTAQTVHTARAV